MSETTQNVTLDDSADQGLGAPSIGQALEALLLIQDEPVTATFLAQHTRTPEDQVLLMLKDLSKEYRSLNRGFELREVAGAWRYYTAGDCADVVERFVKDGQNARLTQASLETLAVVAYRQPVTRTRIAAIRGVNVDGVIRTLMTRGLIRETGTEEGSGALLLFTTELFLERMGIDALSDLPPIEQFLPEIAAIEALTDSLSDLE